MNIIIKAIDSCMDIQDCMMAEEIRSATMDDEDVSMLSEYILCGWPSVRAKVQKDVQPYWSFRDEIVIIDGNDMKIRRIIIPASLQGKVLNQLHMNHMGI